MNPIDLVKAYIKYAACHENPLYSAVLMSALLWVWFGLCFVVYKLSDWIFNKPQKEDD